VISRSRPEVTPSAGGTGIRVVTFYKNLFTTIHTNRLVYQVPSLCSFFMPVNQVSSFIMPNHVLLASGELVSLKNFILMSQIFKLAIDFSLSLDYGIK